jgi:hypothetical protein
MAEDVKFAMQCMSALRYSNSVSFNKGGRELTVIIVRNKIKLLRDFLICSQYGCEATTNSALFLHLGIETEAKSFLSKVL